MTYQETLSFLYQQLPVFHRDGAAAINPGLENTLAFCEHLGNPHLTFQSVHVGGTNGKGSTSHMIAAILQSAGYKVGLYTSPHLKDFRERIRIDGEPIAEAEVIRFVEYNRSVLLKLKLSFFEFTVGMAFYHFSTQRVDIAIIEVGLGGRLDSTNIIFPLFSIITNIGLDHTAILGNTLAEIAIEKAGIIKPETPAIIGTFQKETLPVFEDIAQQQTAPLLLSWEVFRLHTIEQTDTLQVSLKTPEGQLITYSLQLSGRYQALNLPAVLVAIRLLQVAGFTISSDALQKGLSNTSTFTGLKGRWQKLHSQPAIYADTAHNPPGIEAALSTLQAYSFSELWLIIGFARDKEIHSILLQLPVNANYIFCNANLPRALPATELKTLANEVGLTGTVIADVNDALDFAIAHAKPNDFILITGSSYVVGEVKAL